MTSFSERDVIRIFSKRLGIRDLDDVARVGRNTVLKCDMLVASTDVPNGMKPWQIARKSIVSCASDLASKGARPTAAMISLGIPAGSDLMFINGLAAGFARASKEFGVEIVGGDTNEAAELIIDCCMLGDIMASRMPTRAGAKPGDVVVISGPFGLTAAGLAILQKRLTSKGTFAKRAVSSVLEPAPRQLFGTTLTRYFSSSIDSSDGLAISLYQIAANSKVDIMLETVPAARGVSQFAADNGLDANELVFYGGEEYEIVATLPKSRMKLARAAAKKAGVELLTIGSVRSGTGIVRVGGNRLDNRGYVHFDTGQGF